MHAVPQPSVQRLEAAKVLGVERLLSADARQFGHAVDAAPTWRHVWWIGIFPAREARPRKRRSTTSCATASWKLPIRSLSTARRLAAAVEWTRCPRREELGKLIVNSEMLETTMVNRHVGPLPGLWIHQADRRPGAAQPTLASGVADGPGRRVSPGRVSTSRI